MNSEDSLDLARHHGVFRRQLSLFQGVALIVSGTIGAGILGLPYAIAKVGVIPGVLAIFVLGFLMMGLNLLIGDIAVRTKQQLQIAGLAGVYFGKLGKVVMGVFTHVLLLGVLTVYIIGEGEALSALFSGTAFQWSMVFFAIASVCVIVGLRIIKTVELFLSLGLLTIVLLVSVVSVRHLSFVNFQHIDLAQILFPYGVILFALHGVTTVPEAYSLLKNREGTFRKAIMLSSLIVMVVYVLFTVIVIGVTGGDTTEIATVGLGNAIGRNVFVLGNMFAVFAMGTSFLMAGLGLRDSLRWDFKASPALSVLVVCGVPLFVFLAGVRGFIVAIDIVGGVFISLEMLFILLIYIKAR